MLARTLRWGVRVAVPVLTVLLLLLSLPTSWAGRISLAWDPVESATGYRVYYGTTSGQYSGFVDAGSQTEFELRTPADCRNYFVAVKAYNVWGESAEFSEELSGWPQPEVLSVNPAVFRQGSQATIELRGRNFYNDVELSFVQNPEIPTAEDGTALFRIEQLETEDCSSMRANVIVEPVNRGLRAMQFGTLELTTRAAADNGIVGFDRVRIPILFDPRRADINQNDASSFNRIDGRDLIWLQYAHGSNQGDVHYLPDADLTGDGEVDGDDLALLVVYFGACWNGVNWVFDPSVCESEGS